MISTLKDYYKSKGQSLPAIKDRSKTYESLGLGSASAYQGSLDQNVSLLKRLQSTPTTPVAKPLATPAVAKPLAPVAAVAAPVAAPAPQPSTYSSLYDTTMKSTGLSDVLDKIKSALTTQPKKADLYSAELTNSGVSQDQASLKSLDDRMAASEAALSQSEKDIRDRISNSGGLVTESQVQRLVAAEKAPLINEYKTLSDARGTLADRINKATSQAATMADMRYSDANQPYQEAKAQLDLVNPVFNSTLSAAEKDLQVRMNKESTAAAAVTKAKADSASQDKAQAAKGYQYVATPAQRDQLAKQGYEILTLNGRTYAKPSVLKDYAAKKAIDAQYKAAAKKTTTTQKPSNKAPSANALKEAEASMNNQLKTVVGSDGYISPQDHQAARNAWIKQGLSATTFDTKFKGYVNPNNSNYVTSKKSGRSA